MSQPVHEFAIMPIIPCPFMAVHAEVAGHVVRVAVVRTVMVLLAAAQTVMVTTSEYSLNAAVAPFSVVNSIMELYRIHSVGVEVRAMHSGFASHRSMQPCAVRPWRFMNFDVLVVVRTVPLYASLQSTL